jgi:hypothetical protein
MCPVRIVFVLLLLNFFSAAEVVIPDGLEYTPPEFLAAGREPHGDNPLSTRSSIRKYTGKDNSGASRYREMEIGAQMAGMTYGEGKRISFRTLTEEEIKKLMLETVANRMSPVPRVEEITLAGRKAYRVNKVVTHDRVPFQFEFIWVPVHPNVIYTFNLAGTSDELMKTVRDSLPTVKILPGAAIAPWEREPKLHVANDAIRLGMLPSDAKAASGRPVVSRQSVSYFYDGTYIIVMSYEYRAMRAVSYLKAKEPGKYLKSIANDHINNEKPDEALLQPLTAAEVDALLARHGTNPKDGAKLTWTKSKEKENRWERSDGAAAEYDSEKEMLTIATREAWEGKRSKQPDE